MKYTTYFYDSPSGGRAACFASPSQEFHSLDEARQFAQNAADAAKITMAYSFRIESDDRKQMNLGSFSVRLEINRLAD